MARETLPYIILVWRPEACSDPTKTLDEDPWDGMEILHIVTARTGEWPYVKDAREAADKFVDQYASEHPAWKFMIVPVTETMLK